MRLTGDVAIITGGGTGIGKSIANLLAQEGAIVALCGRREQPLKEAVAEITEQNGTAIYHPVDVTDIEQIKDFVGSVYKKFGKISVLINNAGIATSGSVIDITEHDWDNTLCIDLKAIMLMSKAVIPYMLQNQYGRIINIASVAGIIGFETSAAYCAAKGAVINLTRQMALDFAMNNITVNAIAPGFIETDMTKEYLENESYKKSVLDKTPLRKIGKPEDIAYANAYLASHESSFITGQTLVVDGGWTIR